MFPCVVCFRSFPTVALLDSHSLTHTHQCLTCSKILPNSHQLDIHIQELHSPFFSPDVHGYRCLLQACPQTFVSDEKRSAHMRDDHEYPAWFTFHGKSKSRSLMKKDGLRRSENEGILEMKRRCKFHWEAGGCRNGIACKFRHEDSNERADAVYRTNSIKTAGNVFKKKSQEDSAMELDSVESLAFAFKSPKFTVAAPKTVSFGRRKKQG